MRGLFVDSQKQLRREDEVVVSIGGRPFPISSSFVEDLAQHDEAGDIASLGRPLLVVHAVDDEVVEIVQGERIFAAAQQPKGFHPLLDADHVVTDGRVADELVDVVRAWFDRTLARR